MNTLTDLLATNRDGFVIVACLALVVAFIAGCSVWTWWENQRADTGLNVDPSDHLAPLLEGGTRQARRMATELRDRGLMLPNRAGAAARKLAAARDRMRPVRRSVKSMVAGWVRWPSITRPSFPTFDRAPQGRGRHAKGYIPATVAQSAKLPVIDVAPVTEVAGDVTSVDMPAVIDVDVTRFDIPPVIHHTAPLVTGGAR